MTDKILVKKKKKTSKTPPKIFIHALIQSKYLNIT